MTEQPTVQTRERHEHCEQERTACAREYAQGHRNACASETISSRTTWSPGGAADKLE